jgi:hypothetical protein
VSREGREENRSKKSFPFANFALFHVTSASWSFADGHAEMHNWLNAATIAYANDTLRTKATASASHTAADALPNVDSQWVGQHCGGPQNP